MTKAKAPREPKMTKQEAGALGAAKRIELKRRREAGEDIPVMHRKRRVHHDPHLPIESSSSSEPESSSSPEPAPLPTETGITERHRIPTPSLFLPWDEPELNHQYESDHEPELVRQHEPELNHQSPSPQCHCPWEVRFINGLIRYAKNEIEQHVREQVVQGIREQVVEEICEQVEQEIEAKYDAKVKDWVSRPL